MPVASQKIPEKIFANAVLALAFTAPISIAIAQAAAGVVLLSGFWLGLTDIRKQPLPRFASFSFLLFLLVLGLSAILEPNSAFSQLKKSWVLLCFFPLIIFRDGFGSEKAVRFLFWGTVMASGIGIFRHLFEGLERAAPFSGGYTTMALFEAALLPFGLVLVSKSQGWKRIAYALGGIIILVGLILSGTRAGWLAALLSLVIFGLFTHIRAVAVGLLVSVALILALPQSRHFIAERFNPERQGGFSTGRTALWRAAAEPLSHLPIFGYGPGSFKRLVSDEVLSNIGDPGIKSWHSTPLEILMESGPFALIGVLGAVIASLIRPWREFVRRRSIMSPAYLCALVALYLASLTTNIFRDFLLMSLLVILWAGVYSERPSLESGGMV